MTTMLNIKCQAIMQHPDGREVRCTLRAISYVSEYDYISWSAYDSNHSLGSLAHVAAVDDFAVCPAHYRRHYFEPLKYVQDFQHLYDPVHTATQ